MTTTATKTYYVGVIECAIAYYDIEAEDARTAAENWQDGEFSDRDDEALESEGPCNVRELQPDSSWRMVPPSEWEIAPSSAGDPGTKLYSVLLLYPEHANHGGTETYYAWVEAPTVTEAIALAQRQALATNEWTDIDPDEFMPLLVTQGHHYGEALPTD
jgi:hypothetical protein